MPGESVQRCPALARLWLRTGPETRGRPCVGRWRRRFRLVLPSPTLRSHDQHNTGVAENRTASTREASHAGGRRARANLIGDDQLGQVQSRRLQQQMMSIREGRVGLGRELYLAIARWCP